MMVTFRHDGVSATLVNTLRAQLAHDAFSARIPDMDDIPRFKGVKRVFALISAYTQEVQGIDWQPPSLFAEEQALLDSLEQLLSVSSPALLNAWVKAIGEMFAPLAPPEEQGDSADQENPT